MTFERSYNYPLLTAMVRDPRLYDFLSDDFSPPREEVKAPSNPDLWYIVAREGVEAPLGFCIFIPQNRICWSFHTVMPLDRRALAAMRALLGADGWLWRETPCLRAVTEIPAWNRIALRFGRRAGLEPYGNNPESHMKGRMLHAQILLGASKPKDK